MCVCVLPCYSKQCVIYSLFIYLFRSAGFVSLVLSDAYLITAKPGGPVGNKQATNIPLCQEGKLSRGAAWILTHLWRVQKKRIILWCEITIWMWGKPEHEGWAASCQVPTLLPALGCWGWTEKRYARKKGSFLLVFGSNFTGKGEY